MRYFDLTMDKLSVIAVHIGSNTFLYLVDSKFNITLKHENFGVTLKFLRVDFELK